MADAYREQECIIDGKKVNISYIFNEEEYSEKDCKQPPIKDWGHFCLGCEAA